MDTVRVREHYPLKEIQGFYCPEVRVSKDAILNLVPEFKISLITVPAVVNPDTAEKLLLVNRKAERILEIATDNEQENLILGAWGCGIFNNDPAAISAELFQRLIRDKFTGVFENVVFAIPKSKNSRDDARIVCV